MIVNDRTAPEFATTEKQLLVMDTAQITPGIPISVGKPFSQGVTISSAPFTYALSYLTADALECHPSA